jgi:hypothetical protein
MVIENLSESAIIGAITLQKWRIKLDFEHDDIIIDPRTQKMRLLKIKDKLRERGITDSFFAKRNQ